MDDKSLQTTDKKDVVPQEPVSPMDVALQQMNEITSAVVDNIKDDRDKNDEMYDFFKDEIDISQDKNPATREAMAKAIELKMKGTDQMIELLKIKAKLINPQKAALSVNVNLGKFDEVKGGNTSEMIDIVESINFEVNDNNDDD